MLATEQIQKSLDNNIFATCLPCFYIWGSGFSITAPLNRSLVYLLACFASRCHFAYIISEFPQPVKYIYFK